MKIIPAPFRFALLGLAAASLPLVACQRGQEPLPVSFAEVRRLGCRDCSGAEQFSRIQGLAVDARGAVYVANLHPPFLRVWSPDGSLAAFVGRSGSGPGEFRFIADIFPAPDGGFSAIDRRRRTWTFFDAQGNHQRTTMLPGSITQSAYSETERALYVAIRTRSDAGLRGTEIRRWTLEPGVGSTLVAEITNAPPGTYSGSPAAVYNMDAIPGGGFGIGFGFDDYLLSAFGATGSPLYRLTHDVPRARWADDEVEAERRRLRGLAGRFGVEVDPLRVHFMGGSLRYDDAGRAWVRTERSTEQTTIFDVFSPQGEYRGEVILPLKVKSPGNGFDLAGGYMVTVHADELSGVEFVTLWRVSWAS